MFKALSHPHRLNIFMRLVQCCGLQGSCRVDDQQMGACVGQLGQDLGIGPSTVSHHIKELYRAGLIQMEKQGQSTQCRADPRALQVIEDFCRQLRVADPAEEAKYVKEQI